MALCAQRQHAQGSAQLYTTSALCKWLNLAVAARAASPQSRLSASVAQQLRESGLLQHLAAFLSDAADELDAVTEADVASNPTACGSGSGGGDSTPASGAADTCAALELAAVLVKNYSSVCCLLSPTETQCASLDVFLPPAPAATRLAMAMLQACSMQCAAGFAAAEVHVYAAYSTMFNLAAE